MARQQQNRSELIQELKLRYSNYKLFRVWPEWDSNGIWRPPEIGAISVGGHVSLNDFPISPELKARLASWQAMHDAQVAPSDWMSDIDKCHFESEGLNIALQLSKELDSDCIVEYEIGVRRFLFKEGQCVSVFPGPFSELPKGTSQP